MSPRDGVYPQHLVRAMPKAELHVHLEGTVDAATLMTLAERHGVQPPADDIEGVDAWYRFDGFEQFLERYFRVLGLLRESDDFAFIAEQYLARAHAQGVVHVEFHVSACGHIAENGREWVPIHDAIVAGCTAAERTSGISWALIPDISPHLPAPVCAEAMEQVFAHDLTHVAAIGMGGPADNWFTDDFTPIYRRATAEGLHAVAHAAEHGGPDEVRFALEQFGVERIQHGIGVMSDPDVVQLLVDREVACDVCPGSNLALAAVAAPETHPLPAMLDAGITVTLGSDDPPMFQTSLLDEYERAWEWCDLDAEGLRRLATNSLRASFAPRDRVDRWIEQLASSE